MLAEPVQAVHGNPIGQLIVIGGDHATFTRGEILVGIETETGQRTGGAADHSALVTRTGSMRGIFDDDQTVLLGNRFDAIHIARQAAKVHGDDGLRARRDDFLNVGRIDIERDRIDVGKHGPGADMHDHIGGGRKRQRRRDHFVARADVIDEQCQMQRRRARIDGQRVLVVDVFGKHLLKAQCFRAGADPGGTECVDHFVDFIVVEARLAENEKRIAYGRAAVNGQQFAHRVVLSFYCASIITKSDVSFVTWLPAVARLTP